MNLKTIDLETGGFDAEKCGVTQIAISAIDIDTLLPVDRYQSHIKPYGKIYEQKALDGTRLTLEFLEEHGKPPEVVMSEVDMFLKKHSPVKGYMGRSIFIGHNPLFDIAFLNVFFREFSKKTLGNYFTGKEFGNDFIPTHLDTVVFAKLLLGSKMPDYKLGTILEKMEIELTDAHDAMNDVAGTESFAILGINKLRSKGTSSSTTEVEERQGNRFRTTFEIA